MFPKKITGRKDLASYPPPGLDHEWNKSADPYCVCSTGIVSTVNNLLPWKTSRSLVLMGIHEEQTKPYRLLLEDLVSNKLIKKIQGWYRVISLEQL